MKPNTYTLSLSIGQALDNYVTYRTSVPELVSEIAKANPGQSIEVLDNQANEIALQRISNLGMACGPCVVVVTDGGNRGTEPNPPLPVDRITRRVRHVDMDLVKEDTWAK